MTPRRPTSSAALPTGRRRFVRRLLPAALLWPLAVPAAQGPLVEVWKSPTCGG